MTPALIAFGANVGDVHARLAEAKQRISAEPKIDLVAMADPLVTTAVSGENDVNQSNAPNGQLPEYLNTVFSVETQFSADELFQFTCRIESEMGRQRTQRWGPRTIDLDIVLYGQQIIDLPQLNVPHRRMSFRKFVIDPAVQIAADFVDPISGVSLRRLSQRLHQSRRKILWLHHNRAAAKEIAEAIEKSEWELEIVSDLGATKTPLEDFRLLIYSTSEISFFDSARKFAGPWLSLERVSPDQSVTEILAAMQAME